MKAYFQEVEGLADIYDKHYTEDAKKIIRKALPSQYFYLPYKDPAEILHNAGLDFDICRA